MYEIRKESVRSTGQVCTKGKPKEGTEESDERKGKKIKKVNSVVEGVIRVEEDEGK